eukprot:180583-Prymnesium_polylepis.1
MNGRAVTWGFHVRLLWVPRGHTDSFYHTKSCQTDAVNENVPVLKHWMASLSEARASAGPP